MPKVSVIVPIYNTAEYLPRCLDSIVGQTYEDMELILVDDGSTDGSGDICHRYAAKDPRIVVIEQENKGNNAARKAGLRASSGEYIAFVDSDDWIDREQIGVLYRLIEESQADMALCDVKMYFEDGSILERRNELAPGVYEHSKEAVRTLLYTGSRSTYGMLPFVYAKLYRRGLILPVAYGIDDRIRFDEDRAIVWTCFLKDIRMVCTDRMLYNYCIRENGLVRSKDPLYLAKQNYFYDYMHGVFEGEDDILKEQLDNYLIDAVKDALENKLDLFCKEPFKYKYRLDHIHTFLEGKKVVLYGAGKVGTDYYHELKYVDKINICAWVDRDCEKCRKDNPVVEPVSIIEEIDYDLILVAVYRKELYEEIACSLEAMSVERDKIIWGRPYRGQRKWLK